MKSWWLLPCKGQRSPVLQEDGWWGTSGCGGNRFLHDRSCQVGALLVQEGGGGYGLFQLIRLI